MTNPIGPGGGRKATGKGGGGDVGRSEVVEGRKEAGGAIGVHRHARRETVSARGASTC